MIVGCGAVRWRRTSAMASSQSHPLHVALDAFLGLQVECDGDAVSGKYEVRVDASHVRFTFRPDRALNPMQPG